MISVKGEESVDFGDVIIKNREEFVGIGDVIIKHNEERYYPIKISEVKVMKNTSGIYPVEYKVLIKPEKVKEKTSGGLFIPDVRKDREKYATVRGRLIECGAIAFTDPDWLERPKPGQLVLYDRYAGGLQQGIDRGI